MGNYVTKKEDMNFQNIEALKTVGRILKEADLALKDKKRTIDMSDISEVLYGALGAGVGTGISFAALYLGGSVVGLSAAGITSALAAAGGLIGGGMVAGIFVLASPVVILSGIGLKIASEVRANKLRETKEIIYKEALSKQKAIIKALKEEANADKKRIDLLNSLNIMLREAIKDLGYDLGISE